MNPDEAWDSAYTPACRARHHLSGLMGAFAEDNGMVGPDPEVCRAAEYPEPYEVLVRGWRRCLDAARTINARYRADWEQGGGPLTVIAPAVRETALDELVSVWEVLSRRYISVTLDANRNQWDCPYCGAFVDPAEWSLGGVVDDDRCPECYCILWMNDGETDWKVG
ncbi:hypothetical protein H7J07_19130 [Mycobacterium koreense]|uniref:Uncharacterized protein n=1 Tax=Mycolicibacillus koreensis TaxID=1069220 RepID=A0A7I7SI44_9MYCO|nr:hypothetical protein [Mycolicibacillus koreensis]MCV7250309.1 hypothetical protein [Mycolicibacillus koreensis]OSC33695.1 hypothetical protein B8W67_10020 [Mycolicibacillus koreensis]BBY56190.1 hypothetical protein MKOR_34410 [Mycolicibacillus koreensis]